MLGILFSIAIVGALCGAYRLGWDDAMSESRFNSDLDKLVKLAERGAASAPTEEKQA